jgi:hypothetical protein
MVNIREEGLKALKRERRGGGEEGNSLLTINID